jgi:hypothetical protein
MRIAHVTPHACMTPGHAATCSCAHRAPFAPSSQACLLEFCLAKESEHAQHARSSGLRVQLCKVPCDAASVRAMCAAMGSIGGGGGGGGGVRGGCGGVIGWEASKTYMAGEFAAGRNMLSGTYVLPTGQVMCTCLSV